MTKLIETDEEVEKADKGMIPRGGTSKLQLKLRSAGKGSPRTRRYLLNRTKGGPIHGEAAGRRRGVYKANEPTALEALDSAIEKARGKGLLPKGGMMAAAQRMSIDMYKRVKLNPKIKSASKRKENMARAKREFSAVGRLRQRALSRAGR